MQTHNVETQMINDDSLFFTPKKKLTRSRKWREIEEVKAQQRLRRELKEIDPSFDFTMADLV